MESPSPSSPLVDGPGSDNLTATNKLAMETGGALPVVPPSACNATKSPEIVVSSGSKFSALLNGTNNIKPNTTGRRRFITATMHALGREGCTRGALGLEPDWITGPSACIVC